MTSRLYQYVGPDHLSSLRREEHCVQPSTVNEIFDWTAGQLTLGNRSRTVIATFIVDRSGNLWIADRRSEHVACADGGPVMAAGEMTFETNGTKIEVTDASNQSTGFCPEPTCWPAVAAALDRIGILRPDDFTESFMFRRCEACGGINLIKDEVFECAACGHELPDQWNF